MTAAYDPRSEWARDDRDDDRQQLFAELARIRVFEHRYQDFDSCSDRARQIQDQLKGTKR